MQSGSAITTAANAVGVTATLLPHITGLVAAGLGAISGFLAAYVKVKGANLATREDLEDSLQALRRNTAVVEDVRGAASDRSRRIEKTAHYLERQIEEFYGPLFNLVHQLFVANDVKDRILEGAQAAGIGPAQRGEVERFFQQRYFFPVHHQVNDLLKAKLYLVEGMEMPDSFYRYLAHALQEEAQATLWLERQVNTSFVRGRPFPDRLYENLKADFESILRRYRALIDVERGAISAEEEPDRRAIAGGQ